MNDKDLELTRLELYKKLDSSGFLDGLKGLVNDDIAKLFESENSSKPKIDLAKQYEGKTSCSLNKNDYRYLLIRR
jgi:hypothetical protein